MLVEVNLIPWRKLPVAVYRIDSGDKSSDSNNVSLYMEKLRSDNGILCNFSLCRKGSWWRWLPVLYYVETELAFTVHVRIFIGHPSCVRINCVSTEWQMK